MSEYLVSYGRNGALGRFVAELPLTLARGDAVVIRTPRGVELGAVLRSAAGERSRLLENASAGCLLRCRTTDDQREARRLQARERQLFERARLLAGRANAPVEIVDAEVLFDDENAVLQILAWESCDLQPVIADLEKAFGLAIALEDLGPSIGAPDESGGCGRPSCGRESGGCNSCGESGCSSCGDSDLRNYFAHLRAKMDEREERLSLL